MKKIFTLIFVVGLCMQAYTQNDTSKIIRDKAFRFELEPTNYIAKGFSLFCSYGLTRERNLHLGLYTMGSTLPEFMNTKIFSNVSRDDEIRLTFELATTLRYKIPYNLKGESNPYIGLFFGWEKFRHTNSSGEITHLSNFFLTPQIGYEIYVYRQMIYINPCVRLVYELGRKSDYDNPADPADKGPEIKNWVWLPSLSFGIRL